MNAGMVAPHEEAVKHRRFVAATAAQEAELERQIGRNLYKLGKVLR